MNRIFFVLIAFLVAASVIAQKKKSQVPERTINVDFNVEKGTLNTMFKECVGAGRTNEGLRADWQQQLAYVKKKNAGSNTFACTASCDRRFPPDNQPGDIRLKASFEKLDDMRF